jgi:cytochrome c553
MKIMILLLALTLPVKGLAQTKTTKPPAKPKQIGLCVACHGENGRSRVAGTPHLNGQDRLYLANSLRAYRSGTRKAQPMNTISNSLQAKDIEQLAAWYAAQPAGAR